MSENHEAEVHMDNGGHTHDHTHDHGDAHGHSHDHDEVHAHSHEHGHSHDHDEAHGHSHDHDEAHAHSHTRNHSHTHDPQQTRAIINRLKRSIGHLDKVRRMVEDGEDCADVLIQLSAVKSEINNTGKLILKQHMEHCIVEAGRENDQTSIDKMNEAIDRFMK